VGDGGKNRQHTSVSEAWKRFDQAAQGAADPSTTLAAGFTARPRRRISAALPKRVSGHSRQRLGGDRRVRSSTMQYQIRPRPIAISSFDSGRPLGLRAGGLSRLQLTCVETVRASLPVLCSISLERSTHTETQPGSVRRRFRSTPGTRLTRRPYAPRTLSASGALVVSRLIFQRTSRHCLRQQAGAKPRVSDHIASAGGCHHSRPLAEASIPDPLAVPRCRHAKPAQPPLAGARARCYGGFEFELRCVYQGTCAAKKWPKGRAPPAVR